MEKAILTMTIGEDGVTVGTNGTHSCAAEDEGADDFFAKLAMKPVQTPASDPATDEPRLATTVEL